MIAGTLPPIVASLLKAEELETIRQRLRLLPELARRAHLVRDNYLGALGVFLLVFLSTLPVVIPFLLVPEPQRALRVSNAVGIAMLFLTGYVFGRASGRSPWGMGLAMVLLGAVLVALTMALGG